MSEESKNLYNEALDAIDTGDLPTAISKIEESLMADPQDGESYRLYGSLLQAAGRLDDAAKANEKANQLDDDPANQLNAEAAQAVATGDHKKAISLYEDALEIAPDRYDLHLNYALSLIENGYTKDALEASAKAVELEQDDAQAWYLRGRILRLTQQNAEALDAFEKATQLNAELPLAWHEMGMVLNNLGKGDPAIKAFDRVLALVPDDQAAAEAKRRIIQHMMGQ